MKPLAEKVYGNSITLCPWFSPNELKSVLNNINSNDLDKQEEGIRCMELWVKRNPRLLLGVETTLDLAKAIWLRESSKRKPEMYQHLDDRYFRNLLASVITRFTNLITECGQHLYTPIALTKIAYKMYIPDWVVDIRHSAAHSSMPSLEVLEQAVKTAFEWLKKAHWENEEGLYSKYCIPEKVIPAIKSVETPEEDLLVPLLEIQDYLDKAQGKKNLGEDIVERLKHIFMASNRETLISTLLCDGLFFPSFQECIIPSKLANKKLKLRMSCWMPALQMFPKLAMQLLLLELFKLSTRNDLKGQFAGEWIEFILRHSKNRRKDFTGDQSKFCLEVMKWVTPKTSGYLKLLFFVYCKRLTGRSLRKFLSLSEFKVPSNIEMPEIEDDIEPESELEDEKDSDSDMEPIGLTASQNGSTNLNLTLTPVSLFQNLISSQTKDYINEYRQDARETGFSFMSPSIPTDLTQIEFDQIGLL